MSKWFENYRCAWIAEMFHIYGFINRQHLMRKFNISMLQASKDLNSFLRKSSDGIIYNSSTKCYETTSFERETR